MSPSAETRIDLLRLLAELGDDLEAAEKRRAEIEQAVARDDAFAPGSPLLAVIALSLHHYYGAVERCLERAVIGFEGKLPAGADWHRELLRLATLALPGVRPAILRKSTEVGLAELMRFRHFLRHAYAADLAPERLRTLATALLADHGDVVADLEVFRTHVRSCADALRDG